MSHDNITQCIKKLQNAVKCVICLETLKKPVTTKCGHNFCSLCINQAIRSHGPLPCPLCKAPITRRNLRSSNYFQDVVSAVSRLSSAAVKEVLGTELGLLSSSQTPKKALPVSKETRKTPIMTKDRRISSRSLFNTPGNEKTSTVGKVLNVDEQHLDSTPDMLDMINVEAKQSSLKTPSFGNSAQSSAASHPNISLLNKSDSTPTKDSSATEIDDPFQFPVSQKPVTSPKKGKRRPAKRKSIAKNKNAAKNKPGQQNTPKLRQTKARETLSAPPDKSPIDKKVIEAILSTEHHSLTIEGNVPRKRNSNETKRTTTTPDLVVQPQSQLKTKKSMVTSNSKDKLASSCDKTTDAQKIKFAPENKLITEAPKPQQNTSLNKKTEKEIDDNIGDKKACTPPEPIANHQLVHRPMSDTSSSICTEAAKKVQEPVKTTEEIAVALEDKVQTWLHSVVSPEKVEEPVIADKQVEESAKESDEDFESASQYHHKPVEKIRRKRRRIDLEDTQDLTTNPSIFPKLDINEMFGKKAQEKYTNQKKIAECKIYPPVTIPSKSNPQTKKVAPKKRQKRKIKSKECNIYNVPGLSQGVSPFSTPQEADIQPDDLTKDENENAFEPTSTEAEGKDSSNIQAAIGVNDIIEEKQLCVEAEKTSPDEEKSKNKVEVYGWDDERSINPSVLSDQKTNQAHTTKKNKFTRSKLASVRLRKTSSGEKIKENVDDIATKLSKTVEPLRSQLLKDQNCETQESTPQQITEPFTVNADIHHNTNSRNTTQEESTKLPQPFKSPTAGVVQDKCPATPVLAELKDMPIVCVGETQEKSASYFVTTPNSSNRQELLLVEKPKTIPDRPTVELGLLDFSGPSQESIISLDQTTVEPDKILQTCRMVLSNLDTSHTKQTESLTSETKQTTTSDDSITTCLLDFVGRVVDINKDVAKKPNKDKNSKTMHNVNAVLSQLSKDGIQNEVDAVDKASSAEVEKDQGQMSPLFSSNAFPASSATDSSHISTCQTNSVKNSEEMEPELNKVLQKAKTTATKRRRKVSRITMPAKKPRIRIVDSNKSSLTKKHGAKNKPDTKIIADPNCNVTNGTGMTVMETSAAVKPPEAEMECNLPSEDLEDSETNMVCTSNGWGGTKLKIRIFRKGSQDCDTEEKVSSPQKDAENNQNLLPALQADSEHEQPCNKVTVCFKNSASPLSPSGRRDKSQDSSVLIVDSLKVNSKTLKSSKKVSAAPRQSPKELSLKKQFEPPPSPTLSQRSYKISSSWPQTLAQKRAMVVLDKMDPNVFNFHSSQANRKEKDDDRPKLTQDESENVIPNSPLMFAQSQQGNVSPTKMDTEKDLDENEVVCQSWSEHPEVAVSCHDDKSIIGNELIGEEQLVTKKVPPEITVGTEDSPVHDFDESFELISKAANRMQRIVELREAFTKHSHLVERLRQLSKKILEFLPFEVQHSLEGSTESSPVKCKVKRRGRKLSDCSEDDILANQEPDESEVEIESSLPSIMPSIRKRNQTYPKTSEPVDNNYKSRTLPHQGENSKTNCPDTTMEMSEDLSIITSTSKPDMKQSESRLIDNDTEMHGTNTLCSQVDGDILNADISCIAPPQLIRKQIDPPRSLKNNEDPNEIGDSPQSPVSLNDQSEFEDVMTELAPLGGSTKNDSDVEQHGTPTNSSQIDPVTKSQIPSLTPPPHSDANFSDLSNVTDLLQKISEFTEDLRQIDPKKDRKSRTTELSVAENTSRSSQTFVSCQESMVSQSPPICVSQSIPHTSQNSQEKVKSVEVLREETKENSPRRNVAEPIQRADTTPLADRSRILSPQNSSVNSTSNNDSIVSTTSSLAGISSHRKMGIMTSGIRGKALEVVRRFAKKCSSTFHDSFVHGEVTHVIVKTEQMRCDRTLKFLQGIASKIWVVSLSWVVDSMRRKKVMNEESYEVVGDNIDQESAALYAPKRSRLSDPGFKLLKDFVVCCQPPFALFTADQFVEILRLCGASTVNSPEEFLRYNRDKQRIITMDASAYSDSLPDYSAYALTYHATAVSCEWVLESIATFTVQPTRGFPVEDCESQAMAQL